MRLQIKSTGFELTLSLRQYVEEKFNSLEKYLAHWEKNESVLVRVEIAKNTKHHNKGKIFYAETNVDLPSNMIRMEEVGDDMHAAIDKLKDRVKIKLLVEKERFSEHKGSGI